jgi:asparagine synthase (glutamine-hydrolysing)
MLLGLSGGYDSRLLLAAALEAGAVPRLFVGGPAAAADVRLARAIAAHAGLELAHLDSSALAPTPVAGFADAVRRKLEHYDGSGIRGAINDGEELAWRRTRLAGQALELNGGGGEIFRDFWKLPDRPIAPRDFVARVLEFKNLDKIAAAGARFSRGAYRERLAQKLEEALGSRARRMSRAEVASLYTVLRSAAFAGPSNKEMNLLAHGLLPFAEPRLALPSYAVPLRHKAYGRFEAEMIRRLSPGLAALPSSYGHSFSAPAPLARRARETLDRHCRSLLPLPLVFAAYRRLRKQNQYNDAPAYYAGRYLETLFDLKRLRVAEYFDVARVRALDDPYAFSRLLTVELLLVQRDDAALYGKAHQARDVADPQLLHQPRAVGLHRLLG